MNNILLTILMLILIIMMLSRYLFSTASRHNQFNYHVLSILFIAFISLIFNQNFELSFMHLFSPLLYLSLGWLGLYTGLFLGFQDIRRFSKTVWMYAGIDSLLIYIITFIVSFSFIYWYTGNLSMSAYGSIALSISAIEISPLAVSTLRQQFRDNSSFGILLQSLAGMSGLFAILFIGISSPMVVSNSIIEFFGMVFIEILLSVFIGGIAVYALHDIRHSQEFFLWMVAILTITSGLAIYFRLNAIFMNLIVGIMISTFSHRRHSAETLLAPMAKPVFLFLILFAGLSLKIDWMYILLGIILFFIRIYTKRWAFINFFGKDVLGAENVKKLIPTILPLGNLSFAIGIYLNLIIPQTASKYILAVLFFQYIFGFTLASYFIRDKESAEEEQTDLPESTHP